MKTRAIIITRYNLGIYRSMAKHPDKCEQWMENRLKQFLKYTVPSVKAQTYKDFEWFILIDSKTPDAYARKISSSLSGINHTIMEVVWPDEIRFTESNTAQVWKDSFIEKIKGTCDRLVTIRLDSDDAIEYCAIKRLMRRIVDSRIMSGVVDSEYGIMYDSVNNLAYYSKHLSGSPFIARVETVADGIETVYENCHRAVAVNASTKKQFYTVNSECAAWMMVIHDMNKTNRIFTNMIKYEVCPSDVMRQFGI